MATETATKKQEITVISKIQSGKDNLVARLPKGIDRERFFLGILTAVQKSKANSQPGKSLADCDPNSVLLAAYDAAEVGCSLSPSLQLGWLIPYGKEAQFQPSYRFFIQKAYETGEVKTFYAEVVYKSDEFTRQFAPKRNLFHAPAEVPGERSRETALGAYALIEFMDGTVDWEYLTAEQIDRHRKHSKQPNSMKWVQFWEEGWRITPIRVLAKRLPLKNRSFESLVEMVNHDSERDLVIPVEEIVEPTVPRRMSEKEAEKPAESKPEEKPTEKPAEQNSKPAESKPATTEESSTGPQSMFADGEEDPYLTSAEISEFWAKVFDLGWKKNEAVKFMKEKFKIEALKDLRHSQLAAALELMAKERP